MKSVPGHFLLKNSSELESNSVDNSENSFFPARNIQRVGQNAINKNKTKCLDVF